jgi:hypothetical protein
MGVKNRVPILHNQLDKLLSALKVCLVTVISRRIFLGDQPATQTLLFN